MKDIIGLAVLAWPLTLGVLILLAFAIAISLATRYAKRTGRSKWRWALLGFLVVYFPIFWDWIPTVVMHKYYCSTEAGFWVYKSLEQWKQENPGVMETLVTNKGWPSKREEYEDGHKKVNTKFFNKRINVIAIEQDISSFLPIMRGEETLIDTKTHEVLARYVDFATGNSVKNMVGLPGSIKFWMHSASCTGDNSEIPISARKWMNQFRGAME